MEISDQISQPLCFFPAPSLLSLHLFCHHSNTESKLVFLRTWELKHCQSLFKHATYRQQYHMLRYSPSQHCFIYSSNWSFLSISHHCSRASHCCYTRDEHVKNRLQSLLWTVTWFNKITSATIMFFYLHRKVASICTPHLSGLFLIS